jgi:3-(3-hydroxy-phenyl)propionate hydroxylase
MQALESFDIAIVGCGPVGVTAAHLLAHRGLRVLVVERDLAPYDLPRAVHFDHEIMRIFQSAGLAELLLPHLTIPQGSVHFGADGAPIRPFRRIVQTDRLGWASDYFFYQPDIERVLRGALAKRASVTLKFGCGVSGIEQTADGVTVTGNGPSGPFQAQAAYVLACDGGRSTIRKLLEIGLEDLGFDEPWIVVDAIVEGKVTMPAFSGLPDDVDLQKVMFIVGDPRRPTTYVPNSGNHRRWEFMLLPGETPEHATRPEMVDELLSPWLLGEPYELVRSAVYRFHSLLAERWQEGRIFLLGDAAHQTPPFFGQGLCHGIRDAANLAWKLELVLGNRAGPSLLASYELERRPHAQQVIETSMRTGRYICTLDPRAAIQRDAEMRDGSRPAAHGDIIPALERGIIDIESCHPAVGQRFIQPHMVGRDGTRRLLDDHTGGGFVLLTLDPLPAQGARVAIDLLSLKVCRVVPSSVLQARDGELADASLELHQWFERNACRGVIVRPDAYVYGVFGNDAEFWHCVFRLVEMIGLSTAPLLEELRRRPVSATRLEKRIPANDV